MILTTIAILATLDTILTIPNIVFTIGMIGVIFGIYFRFRKPTEDLEKNQLITDKELGTKATLLAQQVVENKAILLAQQVEWEKIANEKKFTEFGVRLDNSILLATNHIHSVDVKVDKINESVNCMRVDITKLGTIIEERIPKKI